MLNDRSQKLDKLSGSHSRISWAGDGALLVEGLIFDRL
jgi:hypothetical protein